MKVENPQLILLLKLLDFLGRQRLNICVFGGWAEELQKITKSRLHKDIDLLYVAKNFKDIDALLRTSRKIREINEKRFTHKRAFIYENIPVELFLVQKRVSGYFTNFWNIFELYWPKKLFTLISLPDSRKINVVSAEGLSFYRSNYPYIEKAREKYYCSIKDPD